MARTISHTLLLTGVLVADAPLHVGSADTGHESDLPLAVDHPGAVTPVAAFFRAASAALSSTSAIRTSDR